MMGINESCAAGLVGATVTSRQQGRLDGINDELERNGVGKTEALISQLRRALNDLSAQINRMEEL